MTDNDMTDAFLKKHAVTRMLFTPSLLEAVLDSPALSAELLREALRSFRVLVLCGEVVTVELRNRVMEAAPHVALWNLYSISECHDVSAVDLSKEVYEPSRKYC